MYDSVVNAKPFEPTFLPMVMIAIVAVYLVLLKVYERRNGHSEFDKGEEEEGLLNYFEALT